MTKKLKIILAIGIIVIVALFIVAYFSNSLALLGLCKPGDKIVQGLGPHFCYTPSGFAGNPCDKATDCGTAAGCVLVDKNKTIGKGICRDMWLGCNIWIDENGKFDESGVLCAD